jgi:hypothetical protein
MLQPLRPAKGFCISKLRHPLSSPPKNSVLPLILGGAAVYRCDKSIS